MSVNHQTEIAGYYETIDLGFDLFGDNGKVDSGIKILPVDYDFLKKELIRLIDIAKRKMYIDGKFPSLFIFGPTGVGKTEIVQQLAEDNGFTYHKLEIQKIPEEQLTGFPYLEDRTDKKTHKKEKVVKLANPTMLPPSDDEGFFVLHFDEFNKADTEKMSAVMNLILTGELGGAADYDEETGISTKYRLPRNTIIVGSGNPRSQKSTSNFNIVNSMDIATSERFHRTLLLEYDAFSWLKNYANKPFIYEYNDEEYKLFTRISPIINYYVLHKALNESSSYPFEIKIHSTEEDTEDHERTLSPRSWTLISDNMLYESIIMWIELSSLEKERFTKISKERFGKDDYAFAVFHSQPKLQVKLLFNQYAEFGVEAPKILRAIASDYNYYSINRIRPSDILYRYKTVRSKVQEKAKEQNILFTNLVASVGRSLLNITEKNKNNINIIAINLSTFFEDLPSGAEDLAMFVNLLNVKNSKNKALRNDLGEKLLAASPKFKEALGNYRYSEGISLRKKDKEEKEVKEAAAAKEAKKVTSKSPAKKV